MPGDRDWMMRVICIDFKILSSYGDKMKAEADMKAKMDKADLLGEAKERFIAELERQRSWQKDGLKEEIVVSGPLSPEQAIGDTGRDDLVILRGREVLVQAVFRGCAGQAFSADRGHFQGTLEDVLAMPLKSIFERAVLVATMNAVLRYLGLVEGTVHCRDGGPKMCALSTGTWISEQKAEKVGMVGLQPALLEAAVRVMGPERVMVSDLAEAGQERCGVKVLDGLDSSRIFEQCPLVLITGSTIVNGTIDGLMKLAGQHGCRVVFFGTTIAGAAYLLGLERWCPEST